MKCSCIKTNLLLKHVLIYSMIKAASGTQAVAVKSYVTSASNWLPVEVDKTKQ